MEFVPGDILVISVVDRFPAVFRLMKFYSNTLRYGILEIMIVLLTMSS